MSRPKFRNYSLGLPVCTICFQRKRPLTELIGVLDVAAQSVLGKWWARFCDEKCEGYHAAPAPVMGWPGGVPECLDCRRPKLPRKAHIERPAAEAQCGLYDLVQGAYCTRNNTCYEMEPVPIKDWPAEGKAA